MTNQHFNAFYKAHLKALKITNIYRSQLKPFSLWFKILYFFSVLSMSASGVALCLCQFKTLALFATTVFFTIFYCMDKKSMKTCVKKFENKYKTHFAVPSLFDQFKYYLWKEEIKDFPSSFSIDKALDHSKIELSKYKNEYYFPAIYLLILSGITSTAFWRIFDDLHLIGNIKIIIDIAVFYISYRYITFKLYILPSKKKNVLEFKQNLQRLKSECK